MNWLRRIRNAIRWRPSYGRVFVSSKQAGVYVSEDSALAYSAVHACVRIISETLAALPWQVYQRLATGRESLPQHGVQWLLGVQPNPEQTAFVFRRTMLAHQLLWGNGFAEIERGLDGRAIWLWPLLPDRSVIQRTETGALVVRVQTDAGQFILPRENVLHFSDGSFDGITGMSRIQLARRAIGAGMAQDVFVASYYGNGASIGGVIENKGKALSTPAKDLLLETFNEKYQGPDRAHKTLYLDNGMEYRPITLPLSDAQFLETRRYQVEEVARWYGVPLHLLNDLTNANYAISYEASKNFVEHTLRPLAVLLEQEANIRLFGARARGATYSRINLSGLMRADPRTRGEYYRSLINAGIMSINEVRELEELNSIGPDGDEHYMQTSMTTVARIAEGQTAPGVIAPQVPPQEPAQEPTPARTDNVIRREALAWWRQQQQEEANNAQHQIHQSQ